MGRESERQGDNAADRQTASDNDQENKRRKSKSKRTKNNKLCSY